MTFIQAVGQILLWMFYGFIVLVEINDIMMWFEDLKAKHQLDFGALLVGLGCRVFIVVIIVKYLFIR